MLDRAAMAKLLRSRQPGHSLPQPFYADADLYARDPAKFTRASDALATRQAALTAAEEEWLRLEELREAGGA